MAAAPQFLTVHFVDGTRKMFKAEPEETCGQVKAQVAAKLEIDEESSLVFALWAIGQGSTLDLRMNDDDQVFDIQRRWPQLEKTYLGKASNVDCRIVYKRERLIPKRIERAVGDAASVHLLYLQGVYEITNSITPCTAEEAVKLAALQVQAAFGDHDPDHHVPGYLTAQLDNFLPTHLLKDKHYKKHPWEEEIFAAHSEMTGQNALDIKLEYLRFVRSFPHYGSTYFDVQLKKSQNSPIKIPKKVILGINVDGVHIHDNKAHAGVAYFPFLDITWDCDEKTFTLHVTETGAMYIFTTLQGSLMDKLIQYAISDKVERLQERARGGGGGGDEGAGKAPADGEEEGGDNGGGVAPTVDDEAAEMCLDAAPPAQDGGVGGGESDGKGESDGEGEGGDDAPAVVVEAAEETGDADNNEEAAEPGTPTSGYAAKAVPQNRMKRSGSIAMPGSEQINETSPDANEDKEGKEKAREDAIGKLQEVAAYGDDILNALDDGWD